MLLRKSPQRSPNLHSVWYHIGGAFPCAQPVLAASLNLVGCLPWTAGAIKLQTDYRRVWRPYSEGLEIPRMKHTLQCTTTALCTNPREHIDSKWDPFSTCGEARHTDDSAIQGVSLPGHQRLQRMHDGCRSNHRVPRQMRHSSVAPVAPHHCMKSGTRCHYCASLHCHLILRLENRPQRAMVPGRHTGGIWPW